MGSIGSHREKGQTDKQFFSEMYTGLEVLDTSRKGGVIYAACSQKEKPDEVFALVMPYSTDRNGYFVHKEQDETMGPYDTGCPARILDLLTPTDNEYANEWRQKCRARLERERSNKMRAKRVTAGTVIRTPRELYFGKRHGYFDTFEYTGRGNAFYALTGGQRYALVSLGSWKVRDFEIVGASRSSSGASSGAPTTASTGSR